MYSKENTSLAATCDFQMADICGLWKSPCGSPPIKIFRHKKGYKITVCYFGRHDFTVPVFRAWGRTFFNLYGMSYINFDSGRDVLTLDYEGYYTRAED